MCGRAGASCLLPDPKSTFKRTLDLSLNNACTASGVGLLSSPTAFPCLSFHQLGFLLFVLPNFPGPLTSLVRTCRDPSKTRTEASSHAWASPEAMESLSCTQIPIYFFRPYFRRASGLGLTEKGQVKQTLRRSFTRS